MKAILHVRENIAFNENDSMKFSPKKSLSNSKIRTKAPINFSFNDHIAEAGISSAEYTAREGLSSQRLLVSRLNSNENRFMTNPRQELEKIVPTVAKQEDGKVYQRQTNFEYPNDAPVTQPKVTISND